MRAPSPLVSRTLDRLRRGRSAGAWLFIALLMLVSAERRLSEMQYNYMSSEPGLERAEAADGDEIKVRLIASADCSVPTVEAALDLVVFWRPAGPVVLRSLPTFDESSPRAPPRVLHV